MYVDSAEVSKNTLMPNLLIFCVLDKPDANNRLHHCYQLMFTGDIKLAFDGMLSATVVSPTSIAVEMPACHSSFIYNFDAYKSAAVTKKKMSSGSIRSQTSVANKMLQDAKLQKVKVLVVFDNTGETLTNAVFSSTESPLGTIDPKALVVEEVTKGAKGGRDVLVPTLYCGFLVA